MRGLLLLLLLLLLHFDHAVVRKDIAFALFSNKKKWSQAQSFCSKLSGGTLAEVKTIPAYFKMVQMLKRLKRLDPKGKIWFGAKKSNSASSTGVLNTCAYANGSELLGLDDIELLGSDSDGPPKWLFVNCDEVMPYFVCQFDIEPEKCADDKSRLLDADEDDEYDERFGEDDVDDVVDVLTTGECSRANRSLDCKPDLGCCWLPPAGGGDIPGKCVAPENSYTSGTKRYIPFNVKLNWSEAWQVCEGMGGILNQPLTDRENQVVLDLANLLFAKNEPVWIGGVRDESLPKVWLWASTGLLVPNNANWGKGQPENHRSKLEKCMAYYRQNQQYLGWHDYYCDSSHVFICEQLYLTTANPTTAPTTSTRSPSSWPSSAPTSKPSHKPSTSPTQVPSTDQPSSAPTSKPSHKPSTSPTQVPSTDQPSSAPTSKPSHKPSTSSTQVPSTDQPSSSPTNIPTLFDWVGVVVNERGTVLDDLTFNRGALTMAKSSVVVRAIQPALLACKTSNTAVQITSSTEVRIPSLGMASIALSVDAINFAADGSEAATLSCSRDGGSDFKDEPVFFPTGTVPAFEGFESDQIGVQTSNIIVLNTEKNATLVSQSAVWASFERVERVTLRGEPCEIVFKTSTSLQFTTPRYDAICADVNDNDDCGFVPLRLLAKNDDGSHQVEVQCTDCVIYARQCVGFSNVELCAAAAMAAVETGNLTLWSKLKCAYGQADDCRLCPRGAYCPGGYLLWSEPGWWTPPESNDPATPLQCLPPMDKRCVGYDPSNPTASTCGSEYVDWACSKCAPGYWPDPSSQCQICPASERANYMGIAVLLGIACGFFSMLFLASLAATHFLGIPNSLQHSKEFAVWSQSVLQVVLVAASLRPPGLSLWLTEFFEALSVVELNFGAFLHPSCVDERLFLFAEIRFAVVISLTLLSAGLSLCARLGRERTSSVGQWLSTKLIEKLPLLGKARWALFVGHTVLYGITTASALRYVNCRSTEDGRDGIWLVSDPWVECYGSDHHLVGVMAWISLIIFSLLYPLWSIAITFDFIRWETKYLKQMENSDSKKNKRHNVMWHVEETKALAHFLANDYSVSHFYLLQMNMFCIFLLTFLHAVLGTAIDESSRYAEVFLASFSLMGFSAILILFPSFPKAERRWKLPTKILSLATTTAAYWLNFVAVMNWQTNSSTTTSWSNSVNILSVLLIILMALLILVLLLSYGWYLRAASARTVQVNGHLSVEELELLELDLTYHSNPILSSPCPSHPIELVGPIPSTPSSSETPRVALTNEMKQAQRVTAETFQIANTKQRSQILKIKKKQFHGGNGDAIR